MKKIILVLLLVVAVGFGAFFFLYSQKEDHTNSVTTNQTDTTTNTTTTSSLDHTKLPLGDNKTTSTPKVGYAYSCQKSFNGGGAFKQGPWINTTNKTWDETQKVKVDGNVSWTNASWKVSESGDMRMLVGNGLPSHTTGVYPISSSDDAYSYDRNPNSIKEVSLNIEVPINPIILDNPECVGGEVGVMLTGVPLYNAFDAGGRDAVATEIQDSCEGHPQAAGQYHYHGPSDCLKDASKEDEHSDLVGYAFDGFGIFGTRGENGVELSSNDLDECHGHTHEITWEGKKVTMYHYHLTHDFPYSVGCFRGKKYVTQPLTTGEPQLK